MFSSSYCQCNPSVFLYSIFKADRRSADGGSVVGSVDGCSAVVLDVFLLQTIVLWWCFFVGLAVSSVDVVGSSVVVSDIVVSDDSISDETSEFCC